MSDSDMILTFDTNGNVDVKGMSSKGVQNTLRILKFYISFFYTQKKWD
jgi:hypothetical protein